VGILFTALVMCFPNLVLDRNFVLESVIMSRIIIGFYTHPHDFNMAFIRMLVHGPSPDPSNQEGSWRAAGLQRDRVLPAAAFAREQWPSEGLQGARWESDGEWVVG
jgi:hypothetical protein